MADQTFCSSKIIVCDSCFQNKVFFSSLIFYVRVRWSPKITPAIKLFLIRSSWLFFLSSSFWLGLFFYQLSLYTVWSIVDCLMVGIVFVKYQKLNFYLASLLISTTTVGGSLYGVYRPITLEYLVLDNVNLPFLWLTSFFVLILCCRLTKLSLTRVSTGVVYF